jgi:hypothetical protein
MFVKDWQGHASYATDDIIILGRHINRRCAAHVLHLCNLQELWYQET